MKGNYFEQLVGRYLEKDGVQAPQYRNVWLWRDWPARDGKKDNGIDLVAERQDGGSHSDPVQVLCRGSPDPEIRY